MINYVLDKTRLARIFQGIGILTLALSILTGCESSLDAERAEQRMPGLRYFDDYQVAYGFVPASSLPTVVRERYGFSDSEAVILTVAVSTVSEPKNVPATITGYTVNLTKQRRQLEFDPQRLKHL